jgi:hypothetical protein
VSRCRALSARASLYPGSDTSGVPAWLTQCCARSRTSRITLERERLKKIAAVRAELAKNAPPIDFAASFDSLDMMEGVMRHFYFRAMIERSAGY